jgi:hypothetical protein
MTNFPCHGHQKSINEIYKHGKREIGAFRIKNSKFAGYMAVMAP